MKKIFGVLAVTLFLTVACSSDETNYPKYVAEGAVTTEYYEEVLELGVQWLEFGKDYRAIKNSDLDEDEKYEQIINIAQSHKQRLESYKFKKPSSEDSQELHVAATDLQSNFLSLLKDGYIAYYSTNELTSSMEDKLSEVTELTGMFSLKLIAAEQTLEDKYD